MASAGSVGLSGLPRRGASPSGSSSQNTTPGNIPPSSGGGLLSPKRTKYHDEQKAPERPLHLQQTQPATFPVLFSVENTGKVRQV
jgi:hypothetical protein